MPERSNLPFSPRNFGFGNECKLPWNMTVSGMVVGLDGAFDSLDNVAVAALLLGALVILAAPIAAAASVNGALDILSAPPTTVAMEDDRAPILVDGALGIVRTEEQGAVAAVVIDGAFGLAQRGIELVVAKAFDGFTFFLAREGIELVVAAPLVDFFAAALVDRTATAVVVDGPFGLAQTGIELVALVVASMINDELI